MRWRHVELALNQPTEGGETTIRPWSNLPEAVGARRVAKIQRTRWRIERSRSPGIESLVGQLEAVLQSEASSLGHPRAALLGFAVAVLAYNVLVLSQWVVEQAQPPPASPLEVSCFHLAVQKVGWENWAKWLRGFLPERGEDAADQEQE